jgi:phenylacetate-CoA ligase
MKILRTYYILPVWLQNIVLTLFAIFNDHRRYGRLYSEIEKEIFERSFWSSEQLKNFQRQRLSQFMKNALNSIYWKKCFKIYGVDVNKDPCEEIKKLPILSKKQVKENLKDIVVDLYQNDTISVHTSGTTGSGLIFCETRKSEAERWATWWRYRRQYGLNRKTWCGLLGGRAIISPNCQNPPYYRINYKSKQFLFSCYHLSSQTVRFYVSALEELKINWLHGYPSFISELASLALKEGLFLKNKPKLITIGAENITKNQSRIIFDFFGVYPVQHYGLSESTANFSQPKNKSYLEVDEDFSYVEFLGNGNEKKIVGTNFTNPAFPLFRYDCGDLASEVDETIFPRRVGSVDGRSEDVVTTPGGQRVGRLDHIFKDAIYVDEAQIYQPSLKKIIIRIRKNRFWSVTSEEELVTAFRDRLGAEIQLHFEYVESIERTSTGKLRFVISEVK